MEAVTSAAAPGRAVTGAAEDLTDVGEAAPRPASLLG